MAGTEGEKRDMGTEQNAIRQSPRVQESTTGGRRETGRGCESLGRVAYTAEGFISYVRRGFFFFRVLLCFGLHLFGWRS